MALDPTHTSGLPVPKSYLISGVTSQLSLDAAQEILPHYRILVWPHLVLQFERVNAVVNKR